MVSWGGGETAEEERERERESRGGDFKREEAATSAAVISSLVSFLRGAHLIPAHPLRGAHHIFPPPTPFPSPSELYKEYVDKPLLPGPLLSLANAYLFVAWLMSCCQSTPDDDEATKELKDRLAIFQDTNQERFLRRFHDQKATELDNRVVRQGKQLNSVQTMLSSALEAMTSMRATFETQLLDLRSEIRRGAVKGELHRRDTATAILAAHTDWRPPLEYPDDVKMRRNFPGEDDVDEAYRPVEYTHAVVRKNPVWADPEDPSDLTFNVDKDQDNINRMSCCRLTGGYKRDGRGRPVNPFGRTGMTGRGLLGRWGPNHAADTIFTRWRRDPSTKAIMEREGKKVLEFICIKRADGTWAVPGGFADPNDAAIEKTHVREFMEEALNSLVRTDRATKETARLEALFQKQIRFDTIYSHDPRNTDNAWVETTAFNVHDDSGAATEMLKLQAGDDAKMVTWMMLHRGLNLYASHETLLHLVAAKHDAYFG